MTHSFLIAFNSICHTWVIMATELAIDALISIVNLTSSFHAQDYVPNLASVTENVVSPFCKHALGNLGSFPSHYFKIILDSWRSHKNSTESSLIPFILPLMLTFQITIVSKWRNNAIKPKIFFWFHHISTTPFAVIGSNPESYIALAVVLSLLHSVVVSQS